MLEFVTYNANSNQFISTINFNKFSSLEKERVIAQLSSFNIDLLTDDDANRLRNSIENRNKGWSNTLRKGLHKVHRCKIPEMIGWNKLYGTGKQPLLQMFHRFKKHDHQRNELLINYREQKGMRLNIRSERQEMYQALDLAILRHLDIDSFGIGLFEITCSVEILAKTLNIFRIDDAGHARYDILLNAISDYEKTKQIIVYKAFDKENKVYKPMRIWLTLEFFKSRGYNEEELRKLLKSRSDYLHKKGLFNKAREKYQTEFLRRLDKAGVLEPAQTVIKKLIRIKNQLIDIYNEKKSIEKSNRQKKAALDAAKKAEVDAEKKSYKYIYTTFMSNKPQIENFVAIKKVSENFPQYTKFSEEFWYQCLLEVGWSPPN